MSVRVGSRVLTLGVTVLIGAVIVNAVNGRGEQNARVEGAWAPGVAPRNTITVIWSAAGVHGSAQPTKSPFSRTFRYRGGIIHVSVETTDPDTTWTSCVVFIGGVQASRPKEIHGPGTVNCLGGA